MPQPQQLLPNLTCLDLRPPVADAAREVAASLSAARPTLDPKYFYDERGSSLFDAITRTPEYYPTRTEAALLREHAAGMAAQLGDDLVIAEPGAGGCEKVRILLDQWRPYGYMPLEISRECLLDASRALAGEYPSVRFDAVCADYSQALDFPADLPGYPTDVPRLVFFPGSTIGNFTPDQAVDVLKAIRSELRPDDSLLIGVDLKKDRDVLERAYDDSQGVTAAFNLNVLHVINRVLQADIPVENFSHRAVYNEEKGRVEMHLVAEEAVSFTIGGHDFSLEKGETIHTENSHKFTVRGFQDLAARAGFAPKTAWVHEAVPYSIHWLECGRKP